MTGAIAAAACADGKVIHLVCVKSDATLGHAIGTYVDDGHLSWEYGSLEGEAHKESRIALGCRNPHATVSTLDVVYQQSSGAIVSQTCGADGSWGEIVPESDDGAYVHVGTDLDIIYHKSFHRPLFLWQTNNGLVGPNWKDGTPIKVPLGARFSFVIDGNTIHFYFLDTIDDKPVIKHFVSGNTHKSYDDREPQYIPQGVSDFKMVEDSVSILQSIDGADGIRASVRLLDVWLNEDFSNWGTFSGPDTAINPDIGITVLSQGLVKPAAYFTYVNAKTGDWICLPVREGQSVGYETVIPVAKGWFEGTEPTPHASNGNGNGNGYHVDEAAGNDKPAQSTSWAAKQTRGSALEPPEWARKFCKDVLMPRAAETVNKAVRKTGDSHLHAVLAPLSKLWDLGDEPLTYKFLEGQYGGNDIQRQKVRASIPEWTWYANVTFKEVGKNDSAHIKITFDPNDGSWSVIGNDSTKEDDDVATMNLGWVKSNTQRLPREERGVILHEFGHALGLLHEHQSPAHGSKSVLDPEATVKFYMKDQGWTEEMVMDQVVKTYNLNDVSNFSQVDTKSIMHYYQPSEVTGGDPIDYNYVFSERDKAYMVINYPRSIAAEKKRAQGKDVTLETALKAVGIADSDPAAAKKILEIRNSAKSNDIDVGQIRRIFTKWARDKHTVKDEKLESTRQRYMRGLLDRQYGIEAVPASSTVLYLDKQDPEPCKYSDGGDAKVTPSTTSSNKSRALVYNDIFTRRPKFLMADGVVQDLSLTWTIVQDPGSKEDRKASKFKSEYGLVEKALKEWTNCLSINFVPVEESAAATADLIIVFQDIHPVTGHTFASSDEDSAHLSYCKQNRFDEADVQRSNDALKRRTDEKWAHLPSPKEEADLYELAVSPKVPHDICLRGIVNAETEKSPPTRKGKWTPADRSMRTVVHELGHFFGLGHENDGFWCKLYEGKKKQRLLDAAKQLNVEATIFDEASVMDVLRLDEKDREVWNAEGFKASKLPTAKDRYNLSLFHAGPHLASRKNAQSSFVLTVANNGVVILDILGKYLKIKPDVLATMKARALEGRWADIRALYLQHKREKVEQMADVIETATKAELAELRQMKIKAKGMQPKMHGVEDQSTAPGPKDAFNTAPPKLKEILWTKLKELFGPSEHATSFLTVQSPARYLDKAEFSYKMEGVYSNFVKPVVVNEAEFRLTDQLYEPLRVVGAPNGQSLSINYEMILNNLVPRYVSADVEIRKAREKMRVWLLEETSADNAFFVNDTRMIGDKGNTVVDKNEAIKAVRKNNGKAGPRVASRMEVCQRLMLEYLEAASVWKSKHSKMIQDAMHVHTDGRLQKLEDTAREIANLASVENNKLSAKYADVVVRGHLHTVRECLAQLDIKSTAEFLQDAKDSLRESALSSLYGASRVLPVIMSPMDWSEGLDTSFDPQDLSADPAIIEMNITAKARQIDTLREQLSSLQHTVKGDEASLRAAMDDASDAYSKAQADLAGSYQESARLLATRIVQKVVPSTALSDGITFVDGTPEESKESLKKMVSNLNPLGTINDLFEQMGKVNVAHRAMMSAGARFSQRQTDWVRAKSATTAEQESAVSRKIESAVKELESLQLQLATAHIAKKKRSDFLAAKVGPNAEKENAENMAGTDDSKPILLPTMADLAPDATENAPTAGSRWIAVVISSKEAEEAKSTVVKTETSQEDWSVSFFGFASGGKGKPKVEGSTTTQSSSSGLDVSISMNCTLVTADRSSWFQPQFFSMSDAFMRNNNAMCWTQGWDTEWQKDHWKAVDAAITKGTKPIPPSFLPCFPTGYIIAKDVLIKISRFQIKTVADKKYLDEKTTSGGSFLFFSTSKTTQKTQDSSSSNFQMASDGMIVRIPGPQVIGYIQQMLPWDGTHQFNKDESLRPDIFLPGDEVKPSSSDRNKPNVGRALGPHPGSKDDSADKREFTVRSTKKTAETNVNAGGGGRAHAPAPKGMSNDDGDGEEEGDMPNGHQHDEGEMDHAMKLISAKLREKLNEPGFLESLLSGAK